jgi:putative spermidine/putrescine transport system ATP-binding protein
MTEPTKQSSGASVGLEDLHRSFGPTRALDGFSLDIAAGELVALLGPSGCGKTTALRVLAGFERADRGRVLVDGRDIGAVPAQRRDMGMVFQSYSLFPNMNAQDNVGFGLRMRGKPGATRRAKAAEVLDMVGLADQARRYPHQLSGGQQQRVALARALAIEPRVLLLDEPLSALDAKVRLQLREQIRLLQTRLAITTVFVTHDQEEALSMADRVCVMRQGRIEQVDTPAALYARPATAFVAEFVGIMNRLPGRMVPGGVQVLDATVPVRQTESRPDGEAVDVLVRPEGLSLASDDHGRGIVMTKTFLGSVTRISVLLDNAITVQVDRPSEVAATLDPGAAVEVAILGKEVMVADRRSNNSGPVAPNSGAASPAAAEIPASRPG